MKAKITKEGGYECAPTGAVVEHFPFGSEVSGQVAEWAIADKAAENVGKKEPKKDDKSANAGKRSDGAK